MTDKPNIHFTFAINDPELDDEQRQRIARNLLRDLRQLEEVEKADFAEDTNIEEGAKSFLAALVGALTAEVSVENFKKVLGFVGARLSNKRFSIIKVKFGNKEIEIKAEGGKGLEEAERVVEKLIDKMKGSADDDETNQIKGSADDDGTT